MCSALSRRDCAGRHSGRTHSGEGCLLGHAQMVSSVCGQDRNSFELAVGVELGDFYGDSSVRRTRQAVEGDLRWIPAG